MQFKKIVLFLIVVVNILLLTSCSTGGNGSAMKMAQSSRVELADINIQLGMAYLQNKDSTRAKQKFLLAMEQAPRYPASWYSMGYYLEQIGDKTEAEHYYSKAVQLAPRNGATQNNYGTYLCRQKKYLQAIEHFRLAVADPNYLNAAEAYENAGICALQIPNQQLAAIYLEKAVQIDPLRPLALVELTKLKSSAGEPQVALQYIEQYLTNYPPTPATLKLAIKTAAQAHNSALESKYRALLH